VSMISFSLIWVRMLSRSKVWGRVYVWVNLDLCLDRQGQRVGERQLLFSVYPQVQSVRQVGDYVDVDVVVVGKCQDYLLARAKVA
jgi:hypothetical protein